MQPRQFYDSKRERYRTVRSSFSGNALRNANNWVKSTLLNMNIPSGSSVLDICCGAGGDLKKFQHSGVSKYVGIDISEGCIDRAKERSAKMKWGVQRDFQVVDVRQKFEMGQMFDCVVCNFAVQFFFESSEILSTFCCNVQRHLKPGGLFLACIPNGEEIIRRSKSSSHNHFGNSLFSVKYNDELTQGVGNPYAFSLKDCIEDCIEYVASQEILYDALMQVDILCEFCEFEDLFTSVSALKKEMGVKKLSEEENEVFSLYSIVVGKKRLV